MSKEIWNKIEEELTGEFARGYALAQHLSKQEGNVEGCVDLKREIAPSAGDVWYDWGEFEDDGDSSPQEWEDETNHIICTDEEADKLAYENIVNSLWAFYPSFLAGETGLPEEVFVALVENQQYDDNNYAVTSLIEATCGLDKFVESAIGTDGRGHYIAHYDHNENEVSVGDTTFYIYKVN